MHKIIVTEILLSSDVILNQLTKNEAKSLLQELLKKNSEKVLNKKTHSLFGVEKNAFAITKLIFNKDETNIYRQKLTQKAGLYHLLINARLKNEEDNVGLIDLAKDFLEEK